MFGYARRQVTTGLPSGASNRYIALSVTMYTPPVSSTANELPIVSSVSIFRTTPLAGWIVPTTPFLLANQIRPCQSGSAEISASPSGTAAVTL